MNIANAYSTIDCIVLPRKDLPITQKVAGLKPVEAFAYKKLVLASDVGGMRELFHDRTHGYLFESGSPTSLAALMNDAVDDKVQESSIKECAFKHYRENFTLEAMGKKYLDAYRQVLAK
ncbi:D-inositol-3-phosphate glycosyltransferase [compost metagenome]